MEFHPCHPCDPRLCPMSASASRVTRPLLVWAAVGVLLALGSQLLLETLWLRAAMPILAWLAAGAVFLLTRLWPARHAGQRREALASAGAVVFVGLAVALASPFLAQLGAALLERWRFERVRPEYDRVLSTLIDKPVENGRHESAGTIFLVDNGPPQRVVFPWSTGTVFSWCGAVHDPSGAVLQINDLRPDGANRDDPNLTSLQSLFGGGMTDCHELDDTFAFCCFLREGLEGSPD